MSCGGVKRYLDVAFETCQTISAGLTIGTTYRLTILAVPIHADKRIYALAARGVAVLRRVVPSQDTERGRTESLAVASAAVRGRDCGAMIYSGICGAASERAKDEQTDWRRPGCHERIGPISVQHLLIIDGMRLAYRIDSSWLKKMKKMERKRN